MAASGYTPISLYYSATCAAVPLAANLVAGELSLNTNDGKLYYKDSSGVVQLLASKATATGPAGSNTQVQFNSSGSFGASANLTWSGTVLAITGALTASTDSSFTSTGAVKLSSGTTGQQPVSPVAGMLRFNTTTTQFEGYNGATWASVGGAAISNDTTTATFEYPLFAAATSGTALTVYTGNANLLYKPSTGEFQAAELAASNGLVLNNATVSASYTIASGYNASSVGPMTINSGITVTISSGQRWLVQ